MFCDVHLGVVYVLHDSVLVNHICDSTWQNAKGAGHSESGSKPVAIIDEQRELELELVIKAGMITGGARRHTDNGCVELLEVCDCVAERAYLLCASWSEVLWVEKHDQVALAHEI